MRIKKTVAIAVLAAGMSASLALAQQYWAPPDEIAPAKPAETPAPAAPAAAPKAAAANKPAVSAADKRARAKDCAAQADAKGLRGEERKNFRETCNKS